jgi:hypothetical protein
MGMHAFPVLYQGMTMADPTYFEDFWSKPGYLGFEAPPSLVRDRVRHECEVAATITEDEAARLGLDVGTRPGQARGGVDTAWRGTGEPSPIPVALRLSSAPGVTIDGAELHVTSGAAAGARLLLLSVKDDIATFGPGNATSLRQLRTGDAIRVDNSGFLAAQTYHRHQVPDTDDYPVWKQFCHADGAPIYPQRPLLLGPLFAAGAAGTVQTGRFTGKMIVVASLLDREALPWQADWYRTRAGEHFGEAVDEHFRLWFTDNAVHGDDDVQEGPTHTISYVGVLHQALRDVSRWVEEGVAPPASTSYEVSDGQITAPADATVRGGIQPVVSLTANGRRRADVAPGDDVTLYASAQVPDGTGSIVTMEWDFDGAGSFPTTETFDVADRVEVEHRHSFVVPGTYFPTVRVAAHRAGDSRSPYARVQNLARVRVVVTSPS